MPGDAQGGNAFKFYQRGNRVYTTEENFKDGVVFTRAPLATGKTRLLVNYDLINEKEAITNRKGIRPTMVGLPFASTGLMPSITDHINIGLARDAIEEDDLHYRLMIANKVLPTAEQIAGTNLYKAPAELWIINTDNTGTSYEMLSRYDVEGRNMYAIPISYETSLTPPAVLPQSYYHIPDTLEANGITMTNKENFARQVGAFAFGNTYYNFNDAGELIRSRYEPADPEEGTSAVYIVEKLDPKEISASDATTTGFNMLSETPYVFSDSFAAGTIQFDGIMVYDSSDTIVTEPVKNTKYKLRCFYTIQSAKKYKIKWDWRETGTNDYTDLSEEEWCQTSSVTVTVPAELSYNNFESSVNDAVIRIQAFPWDKTPTIATTTTTANCVVSVNPTTYVSAHSEEGAITFTYSSSDSTWKLDGTAVSLGTYGITFTDVTGVLADGDTIRCVLTYTWEYQTTAEKTISMGITFVDTKQSTTSNKDLKNYDLTKATGMCYWKNYLWLYGLAQDPTILFCSDINEPTYFPYPNNVDIFDEPILHLAPFNDTLLVFTRSNLFQLTLSSEGGWTRKLIQGSLDFNDFDVSLVQIVKNMVFFKSGDYYYMVVPKTLSLQQELAIAPVSKNIEYFLDEFETNVTNLLDVLYDYTGEWSLVAHYDYLNYEDVHVVYTVQTADDLYINICLLYNTVDRYWRIYTYESQELYKPIKQDATKDSILYSPQKMKLVFDGTEVSTAGVCFYERDRISVKDFYIPQNSTLTRVNGSWTAESGAIQTAFDALHTYKNWQLMDTGYRDIVLDHNKRCRELQFKFNNVSEHNLKFFTDFILDGETRVDKYTYTTEHITEPGTNFGLIYVSRTPVENLEIPGTTALASATTETNMWTLDNSQFPELAYWKARLKVSGKGYVPRVRLIARSEERFELLGYTWVYRTLYLR